MSSKNIGEYKLLFLLPVFPDTRDILFIDFESDELRQTLSSLGINVFSNSLEKPHSGQAAGPDKYDLVLAGKWPSERAGGENFFDLLDRVLSGSGQLVAVVSNRFSYKRLIKKIVGRSSATVETSSLRSVIRLLEKNGFSRINLFSPIPDLKNPSVIISLDGSNSLQFLFNQFPDFMTTRSGLIRGMLKLLNRTGIYKYILEEYVVVAGKH